jgi:hypothetical protein
VLLAGLVALLFNSNTTAQEAPPEPLRAPAADIGPSFTYQGYLEQGGVTVTDSCDFEFRLYGVATGGTQIGTTQSLPRQALDRGRFTVALDFGASAMNGQARWLQIAVRCPTGSGAFTTLTPRQALTASPYALTLRPGAVVAGTVVAGGILELTNSGASSGASGLRVASAPIGVLVQTASQSGVYVASASIDGVNIVSAGDDAIQIGTGNSASAYGLYVPGPGTTNETLLPNTANPNGQWALYTTDWIYAANIGSSAQTIMAVAASDLAAGDAVSAAGLADPLADGLARLAQVRTADGGAGVIGVVASRVELQPAPGKDGLLIPHSVAGPAKTGDYVVLTVLGAVQVRALDGSAILPGQRVTVGENGAVRALQTRTIEGMVVAEGAPTLGVALQAPQDGLVWVFVSPQ